jgi:hypothetical protein
MGLRTMRPSPYRRHGSTTTYSTSSTTWDTVVAMLRDLFSAVNSVVLGSHDVAARVREVEKRRRGSGGAIARRLARYRRERDARIKHDAFTSEPDLEPGSIDDPATAGEGGTMIENSRMCATHNGRVLKRMAESEATTGGYSPGDALTAAGAALWTLPASELTELGYVCAAIEADAAQEPTVRQLAGHLLDAIDAARRGEIPNTTALALVGRAVNAVRGAS